jgi:predicted metal-dependent hydrolase
VSPGPAPARVIVGADGRAKAYRPLPVADRVAGVQAGLEAYDRGDYFEAHELMEPAWMGSDDPAERSLIQGLIKLAAADVHGVRGNPRGIARNLEGARDRLREALAVGADAGVDLDLPVLLDAIDRRLADLGADRPTDPIPISWRPRRA